MRARSKSAKPDALLTDTERDEILIACRDYLALLAAKVKRDEDPAEQRLAEELYRCFEGSEFSRLDVVQRARIDPRLNEVLLDNDVDASDEQAEHWTGYKLRDLSNRNYVVGSALHLVCDDGRWSFVDVRLTPWR